MTDNHQEREIKEKEEVTLEEDVAADHEEDSSSEGGAEQNNSARIQELESLIEELKEQSVRALAEADNTRKRAEREIIEAHKYAVTNITKDLIDVLENLYRATEYLDNNKDLDQNIKNVIEGIELTKNSFIKTLEKYGVKRINPQQGDNFDHNLHQAISQQETKEHEPGKIMQVVQAGYMVGDRLTRPAMVIVSK